MPPETICCSIHGMTSSSIASSEVVATKPTAEFDATVTGSTPMTADRFVGQLYQELKAAR